LPSLRSLARRYDDRTSAPAAELEGEEPASSERCLSGLKVNASKGAGKRALGEGGEQQEEDVMAKLARVKSEWYAKNVNSGITGLKWGDNCLYSSSRRGDGVVAWDMRMLADESSRRPHPVRAYARSGDTNQRLEFDLGDGGNKLFVGSKDSCVRVYQAATGEEIQTITGFDDCCNGISVSDRWGMLAVATGQRHYPLAGAGKGAGGSSGEESEGESEVEEGEEEGDAERGGTLSVLKWK
jgi:hypothetical protein